MTEKHLTSLRFFLILALFVFAGPRAAPAKELPPPSLHVVATTTLLADLTRSIGFPYIQVDSLMGPGVDPHLYQPTRTDMKRLKAADAIIYHGLHLEGQMVRALSLLAREKPAMAVAEQLPGELIMHDHNGRADPHIWMDPDLWILSAAAVRDFLIAQDPAHERHYQARYESYVIDLQTLKTDIQKMAATISPDHRVLITAHDAFGYYGRAFGFEVIGVQGLSTESEAGLQRIEELVAKIVKLRLPAIFPETSVTQRNIDALAEGAQAAGLNVRRGGKLFSDSLGAAHTREGTYQGMMLHNARAIAGALAPAKKDITP